MTYLLLVAIAVILALVLGNSRSRERQSAQSNQVVARRRTSRPVGSRKEPNRTASRQRPEGDTSHPDDAQRVAREASHRSHELFIRGRKAADENDLNEALGLYGAALAEAYNACRALIVDWESEIACASSGGGDLQVAAIGPLENLLKNSPDENLRPPLMQMLEAGLLVRMLLQLRCGAEATSFSFPTTEEFRNLVHAELAVRSGIDAIIHQLRSIRTALNSVGETFQAFSALAETDKDPKSVLRSFELVFGSIRNAAIVLHVGISILEWPVAPAAPPT